MFETTQIDTRILSEAVVVWTGYAVSPHPTREDAALESVFPSEQAAKLARIVKQLEADFYKSPAQATASNLSEMSRIARSDFRRTHPELPELIADVFAWCYTFDHK